MRCKFEGYKEFKDSYIDLLYIASIEDNTLNYIIINYDSFSKSQAISILKG